MAENTQLNTSTVPIPTASGGSGVASATAYGTLCGGTTTTAAAQVVAPGTAGYVLRSQGAGALPAFQPPDLILVGTASVTGVASIDFTDLSVDYFAYKFVLQYMNPVTNGDLLLMRVSTDNGATFISSVGYSFRLSIYTTTLTNQASSGATSMPLTYGTSNTATTGACWGEVLLINPAYSPIYTTLISNMTNVNGSGVNENIIGYCRRTNAEANNAVRFQYNSGNIADGMIRVYGYKEF